MEDLNKDSIELLKRLQEKYAVSGQDLNSYLEGLLHMDYLKYWDYIHLETLLSLQHPITDIPDEVIFITYHQITELYFKLVRTEIQQIQDMPKPDAAQFLMRLQRINRYFQHLVHSFDVMVDGMDPAQFLKFRMALLPASGFQSAQIRQIELSCTPLVNLLEKSYKDQLDGKEEMAAMYEHIYWKRGSTELSSGKKTLTLTQFEEKYDTQFLQEAKEQVESNIYHLYMTYYASSDQNQQIKEALKELDATVNVDWRLAHFKSAVRYLQRDPDVIKATGGTNWQKYLPPRFQQIQFFPSLWTEEELSNWGAGWVRKQLEQSFR